MRLRARSFCIVKSRWENGVSRGAVVPWWLGRWLIFVWLGLDIVLEMGKFRLWGWFRRWKNERRTLLTIISVMGAGKKKSYFASPTNQAFTRVSQSTYGKTIYCAQNPRFMKSTEPMVTWITDSISLLAQCYGISQGQNHSYTQPTTTVPRDIPKRVSQKWGGIKCYVFSQPQAAAA